MEWLYPVYGLQLRADQRIPGLQSAILPGAPSVAVHLGMAPEEARDPFLRGDTLTYRSRFLLESGEPVLKVWQLASGALLRVDYFDGMQFWVGAQGTEIWAVWPDSLTLEDATAYLLGPVLGFVLRLRGVTCLHASAVAFGDRAVAFVGDAGAGKSTTAAAFAGRGNAVLSDDIVALLERDGTFFVLPAYPYLCLWPDSAKMLYGAGTTLPRFSANDDKRQLLLTGNGLRFEEQPRPLKAIFILGERTTGIDAPLVERLRPQENLLSLVANSYATNLLNVEMRAREFELLGRLIAAVPIWSLHAHADPSRIDQLCGLIQSTAGATEPHAQQFLAGI